MRAGEETVKHETWRKSDKPVVIPESMGISIRNRRRLAAGIAMAFVAPSAASAQPSPPPPSGQVLRDIDIAPIMGVQKLKTPEGDIVDVPTAPALSTESGAYERVDVRSYRLVGATVFDEEALLALIAHRTGPMSIEEIDASARIITDYYRERGYLVARAYVPEQELTDGVVTIGVLEGRYDAIEINNRSGVSDERIRRIVEAPICDSEESCAGALVRVAPLERGMLLLSDTPGVAVRSQLRPGAEVGASTLVVEAARSDRFAAAAEANNYGSRYTGKERLTGAFAFNNLGGLGDQLIIQAIAAENTVYGSVQYTAPIGYDGARVTLRGSRLDYSLGDAFDALEAHGDSYTVGLDLSHPFIRRTQGNFTGRISYSYNVLRDEIDTQSVINRRKLQEASVEFSADRVDTIFGPRAVTAFSIGAVGGKLDLDDPNTAAFDALTAKTAGYFGKATVSLSRLQAVTGRVSLFARAQGQYGFDNLDSFEKMSLGGPALVRAYPVGEASGDRAYAATAELRWSPGKILGASAELKGFFDYGESWANTDPWAAGQNRRAIHGAGGGIGFSHESGATLKAVVAFRTADDFRSEPDAPHRVWVSAGFRF